MVSNNALRRARLLLGAVAVAVVLLGVGPVAHPATAQASTASTMESRLLGWINNARANRGLPALTATAKLMDLAGDRAAKMVRINELKHAKCLSCKLKRRGIRFHVCAEVIAYTTYPWGDQAAKSIFNAWKSSSEHWSILMSRSYHRIGIGVAYRSGNHRTYAAGVLTD